MDMDYEEEIKNIEAQGYKVQDGFINEYGERYFIFNKYASSGFQIAGSETDWNVYVLADSGECAYRNLDFDRAEKFEFTDYEKNEIKLILQTLKHACIWGS
jgi:hypothetical protein